MIDRALGHLMAMRLGRKRCASLTWAMLALTALISSTAAAQTPGGAVVGSPAQAPGLLVRLADGRHLNFRCVGQGSPTVILESGFGGDSLGWPRVVPLVASQTRICSYDRAGYGFSDPGPLPRDGEAIARDLDHALARGHITGPFVLVGHSAGGLYALLVAARRPREVVGIVLVDPSVPHQTQRIESLFGPGAGSIQPILDRVGRCLEATKRGPAEPRDDYDLCVPKAGDPHQQAVAARAATWRTQQSELETLFTTTSDQVMRIGDLLKEIPRTVLTASKTGVPAEASNPEAVIWEEMHRELAAQSRQGSERPVQSSHLMMRDKPDVVADAILERVAAARRQGGRRANRLDRS